MSFNVYFSEKRIHCGLTSNTVKNASPSNWPFVHAEATISMTDTCSRHFYDEIVSALYLHII